MACGESTTLEFKRSLTEDVDRELRAFAKAGGGTVLVGVSDAGKIVGAPDHNGLKSRVLSAARWAHRLIEVRVESVVEVLRVVRPPQKRKPYSFGGQFFMRDLVCATGRLHFDIEALPRLLHRERFR